MGKVQVHEHALSYQAISTKSPHGLQCLKALFNEYDGSHPSRMNLNKLFAKDFQDAENGSERSIGRDEAIDTIISSRARCIKHQIDLKHAHCIENSSTSHSVFFEGVRFMFLAGDADWTRVPFSGRIEVRIKENKFTLKDAVVEIASRRVTSDCSQLVKRDLERDPQRAFSMPTTPLRSPVSSTNLSTRQIGIPGIVELPALGTVSTDSKSLPPYHSPALITSEMTGAPTFTSGSSIDGDQILKRG